MVDIGELVKKLRKGLYWLGGDYTCKKYMKVFRGKDARIEIYFPFDDFVSGGEEPKLLATIELRGTNGQTKREIKFHHVQHTKFRRGFTDPKYLEPLMDIILEYGLRANVRGGVMPDAEGNHRFFKSRN